MDKRVTLVEHLKELKSRLLKAVIFVIITSCLFYGFIDTILPFLIKPVGRLIFIAPQEAFVTKIKIALFGGLFLSSPFVLYQIWQFVKLGLKEKEKRYVKIFGPLSYAFFIIGSAFGCFAIAPIGIKFLLTFGTDLVIPMVTMDNYVSFFGVLTLVFGTIFELPLAILFLTKIGIVTPQFLSSKRREAVVLIFVLAAILTPPDVITQFLMAIPLLVLYEIGIIFSKMAYKRRA